MALLQNEDFTIWQLRTSYLSAIRDGVGDRLINVNSSVLNTPGFRAAGWSASSTVNAAHIKRTYSPPIPTKSTVGTALGTEYFEAGGAHNGDGDGSNGDDGRSDTGFGIAGDREDDGSGMVAGENQGANAPGMRQHQRPSSKKSRKNLGQQNRRPSRSRELQVEEDSSDLSEDSDDDADRSQLSQPIQFTKVPIRQRADSSPIRSSDRKGGPEVLVTSPSVRSVDDRFRRVSLGAIRPARSRPRRDTTTSSDLSSEGSLKDRQIHFSKQKEVITHPDDDAASEKLIEEVEMEDAMAGGENEANDFEAESVGSAISSDFGATTGSGSLLDRVGIAGGLDSSSPLMLNKLPTTTEPHNHSSPKKNKHLAPMLQTLPPPRPVSTVDPPISMLSNMLQARKKAPANPVEKYAALFGKGSVETPLYVKIYTPSSNEPDEPMDMPLARESKEGDLPHPITVAEAIGVSLWKYIESGRKPALEGAKLGPNQWNLRMVEDGEVDYDFPPLVRTRPIIDFTSNNNRAVGLRGRSKSKPYDEFALVEATASEFDENEALCPKDSVATTSDAEVTLDTPEITNQARPAGGNRINPILGQPFSSALNDSSLTPADLPAAPTFHATPRMGTSRKLRVRYIDLEFSTRMTTLNTPTDSYIAEILDSVCKKWGLDKGNFLLKVMGSNTIAPLDRTVEALGNITELDLIRRRFGGGPLSLTGSPGSSSPNAPLLIENPVNTTSSKKSKKGGIRMLHPLSQKQDIVGGYYRRYHVIRKQSMSFTTSSHRVLAFDHDYMHILPVEAGKTLFETNTKTTSISFSDVVGSKVSRRHPKSFRVVVLRGNEANEQKRYDFEARNAVEAAEIVDEIKKNMTQYRV